VIRIEIQVTEEWNRVYDPSEYFRYPRRPFQRASGEADRVAVSETYSKFYGEPVWIYSWGNARWLRCPMGIPGDVLNDHGDRIHSVDVELVDVNKAKKKPGRWVFVVLVEEGQPS
jgi:hypothetical protein